MGERVLSDREQRRDMASEAAKRRADRADRQRRAVQLLSEGLTLSEVAERFGVSRETVTHWRRSRAEEMEEVAHG